MFWASYSDLRETRRKVYLLASAMFIIAAFLCISVTNIWWLMILRALQATGSSAVLCIGAGTLSDIYVPTGIILVKILCQIFIKFTLIKFSLQNLVLHMDYFILDFS